MIRYDRRMIMDARMETLLKVYETRNFTRAAEQLSLTQPAVSQHIKQLEHDLDATLFIRGEKGLQPTPEGEIVVKYARRIQTLYQNLAQSLEDEKRNVTRLSVGITHSSESSVIAEVLAGYTNLISGSHITIISDTINNLYYKLKTYVLDIAIIEGRINDPNFNSVMLDTDSLILAVSRDNPLSQKQIVTLDELKRQKLILRLPDSATRNLFMSHLESNNVTLDEFNVILEVDNVATIKDLVRRNFGVSILPRSTFASEMRKGKMAGLSIENLSMTREINMIYHKDFEHINALQEITRIYKEYSRKKNG